MAITFPDFTNPHLFWMTLCAAAPKAPDELVKWMTNQGERIAAYKTERGESHIRLILGGRDGNHIHFDVYAPEIASKKPKRVSKSKTAGLVTQEEIQKSVKRLFGLEIEGRLRVGYTVKVAELPETGIIRAFSFETKMGTVSLKLDGAMFSIKGAPVHEITWNVRPDGDIAVTLEAHAMKTTITEDYLVKAIGMADVAFNVFVMGKASNEQK